MSQTQQRRTIRGTRRPAKVSYTRNVGFFVTEKMYDDLADAVEATGRTASDIIRGAVESELKNIQKETS